MRNKQSRDRSDSISPLCFSCFFHRHEQRLPACFRGPQAVRCLIDRRSHSEETGPMGFSFSIRARTEEAVLLADLGAP